MIKKTIKEAERTQSLDRKQQNQVWKCTKKVQASSSRTNWSKGNSSKDYSSNAPIRNRTTRLRGLLVATSFFMLYTVFVSEHECVVVFLFFLRRNKIANISFVPKCPCTEASTSSCACLGQLQLDNYMGGPGDWGRRQRVFETCVMCIAQSSSLTGLPKAIGQIETGKLHGRGVRLVSW